MIVHNYGDDPFPPKVMNLLNECLAALSRREGPRDYELVAAYELVKVGSSLAREWVVAKALLRLAGVKP